MNLVAENLEVSTGNNFQMIPIDSIRIVERPSESNSDKLFYNPRNVNSFTDVELGDLQYSIRVDGLQQCLVVRQVEDHYELIAGERRLRCLQAIFEKDLECYDDSQLHLKGHVFAESDRVVVGSRFGTVTTLGDVEIEVYFDDGFLVKVARERVFPVSSGRKIYKNVQCKVHRDCDDARALKLAFVENEHSKPLGLIDEVNLVERLESKGLTQAEIAEMLGVKVPWVSQTLSFRKELPQDAFTRLLNGSMARAVAISILSYHKDDREGLFANTVLMEKQETEKKIADHRAVAKRFSESQDEHVANAIEAQEQGDDVTADKELEKAARMAVKADEEVNKIEKIQATAGTIKQRHVKMAAVDSDLQPKRPKTLDENDIQSCYVEGMIDYLDGGIDPVTGQVIPIELSAMVYRTAQAIVDRERDPLAVIRRYMIDQGKWSENDQSDV